MTEEITITKEEYNRLLERDKELQRLERNGVDNWEGYSMGWEDSE